MVNSEYSENKNWYALYTKPRHEFKAELQLQACGIEYYLPTVIRIKQWSDRKKKIKEPLFNGYIFVFGTEKDRLNALEKKIEKGHDITVTEQLKIRSHVKIISGPFKDVEGIVYENSNQEKMLAITIDLLRRSVVVKIPRDSIIENKSKAV